MKQINFSSSQIQHGSLEQFFENRLNSLVTLNLSDCQSLEDSIIDKITSNSPNITDLNLSNNLELTNTAIYFISRLGNLKCLNLNNCSKLTSRLFTILSASITTLEKLYINSCVNAMESSIFLISSHILEENIQLFLFQNKNLELFSCDKTRSSSHVMKAIKYMNYLEEGHFETTDINYKAIASLLNNKLGTPMHTFHLKNCEYIDDECVDLISSSSNESLKYLSINDCNITDGSLYSLSNYCNQILYLDISRTNITDQGIEYITQSCTKIVTLLISHSKKITSNSIQLISNLHELRELDLSHSPLIHRLEKLSQGCPYLKFLNLSHSNYINDDSILDIYEMSSLEELDLYGCLHITDLILLSINSEKFPSLKRLRLGKNKISNPGLEDYYKKNPKLFLFYSSHD